MSHDVDLIVTRAELAQLGIMVDELSESHHLAGTKWRGTWRGIHMDLYAPYQSRLGANLQLRVEALAPYAEVVEDRRLLSVPAHIATKVAALLDRPDSLPGRKDRQELLNLLALPGSAGAPEVIKAASARTRPKLRLLYSGPSCSFPASRAWGAKTVPGCGSWLNIGSAPPHPVPRVISHQAPRLTGTSTYDGRGTCCRRSLITT